jgi:cob(I)alamin adenosyltransferase
MPARRRRGKKGRTRRRTSKKKRAPSWSTDEVSPGLVHVYTGDGKGKTTAAIGLIVRAAGQGLRCLFIQFMKGKYPYGEVKVLRSIKGVTVKQYGTLKFVSKGKARKVDRREARKALEHGRRAMASGRYDLVVLDEVLVAVFMDLIKAEDLIEALAGKKPKVEVVLTGRKATKRLLRKADYVTVFDKGKHPFDDGILARKGIEF